MDSKEIEAWDICSKTAECIKCRHVRPCVPQFNILGFGYQYLCGACFSKIGHEKFTPSDVRKAEANPSEI